MWTTVAQYAQLYEAHLARARLESEGLEVMIADEHTVTLQSLYADALGGVRVQVLDEDADRARAILEEDRSQLLDDDG
ncbi:putative signal transducing protein [Mangrovitalea sediminis]|uniref:putative signal transducing protein n=1 Tax=Mangrovitalea sediminis TaxID=1982043 RepID=UPI000BE503D3|nr:DUF2007 domain-containing protein [Mangrovitalea sediminis]